VSYFHDRAGIERIDTENPVQLPLAASRENRIIEYP
jgi:hypothetical protein